MSKVLVAEDDDVFRFAICEILTELEMDYETVTDGQECFERIYYHSRDYSLVLMDIHMPVKSGPEAVKQIRDDAHQLSKFLPIVAMTGDLAWQNRSRAIQAGFCGVLIKPVPMRKLVAVIQSLA